MFGMIQAPRSDRLVLLREWILCLRDPDVPPSGVGLVFEIQVIFLLREMRPVVELVLILREDMAIPSYSSFVHHRSPLSNLDFFDAIGRNDTFNFGTGTAKRDSNQSV